MLKLRPLILLVSCIAVPAQAGLLSDDEARKQIQQTEGRVLTLEERAPKLEERVRKLEERVRSAEDTVKQHTKSSMDLQSQIEVLNLETRKLRGQNEELAHGLRDAEKREKDFYVDLDTRLRHFESQEEKTAAEAAAAAAAKAAAPVTVTPDDPFDPAAENRAFEAAYGLFKKGSHADAVKAFQEFLKKYPESVHAPNAGYWLGNAQFSMKDYKGALATYRGLLKAFPAAPKAADALLGVAGCLKELKLGAEAEKTLKQLIAKYPASEAAAKAKNQLATAR